MVRCPPIFSRGRECPETDPNCAGLHSGRGLGGVGAGTRAGAEEPDPREPGAGAARHSSGPAPSGHSDIAQAGKHGGGSSLSLDTRAGSRISPFSPLCRVVRPEPPKRRRSCRQSSPGTSTCGSLGDARLEQETRWRPGCAPGTLRDEGQ